MLSPIFLDSITTLEEIEQQITRHKKLYSQLVGQLYPPIVLSELDQLYRRRLELERTP